MPIVLPQLLLVSWSPFLSFLEVTDLTLTTVKENKATSSVQTAQIPSSLILNYLILHLQMSSGRQQASPQSAMGTGMELHPSPMGRAKQHPHCWGLCEHRGFLERCPFLTAPCPDARGLHTEKPETHTQLHEGQRQCVSCVYHQPELHLQLSHGPGAPVLSADAASRNHPIAMATASHALGMLITLGRSRVPSSSLRMQGGGKPQSLRGLEMEKFIPAKLRETEKLW